MVKRRGGRGDELLGVGQVAALLGVSTTRVWQLRDEGRLPKEAMIVSGRRLYRRADVEAFQRRRQRRKGARK